MSRNPIPRPESTLRAPCPVCGCARVQIDEVSHGASRLELGECPRCEHRWTRSLRAPQAPARALRQARERAIPPQRLQLPDAA